jgi:hypothetical protein
MGVELLAVPTVGNVRLRNQFGRFTLARTPFPNLEEYVTHCSYGGVALKKFLIPGTEGRHAIADLDAMGINHARIFPELLGCAMAAEMEVALSYGECR